MKTLKNSKTLIFSTSNSSSSINRQIINYASNQLKDFESIDLRDYDVPIYSSDIEKESGVPMAIEKLAQKIAEFDSLIIGLNEHNGYPSAFFKNILDWLTRYEHQFLKDKKVVLISSSPGKAGGLSSLEAMAKTLPIFGAKVVSKISVGSFYKIFQDGKIIDEMIDFELKKTLSALEKSH